MSLRSAPAVDAPLRPPTEGAQGPGGDTLVAPSAEPLAAGDQAPKDAALRTVRLFLALWPDVPVRSKLAEAGAAWDWPAGVALAHPATLHMTLHFLGLVPADHLPALRNGLAVPFRPFHLCLDEFAVWRHGIAVLQAKAVPPAFAALHNALREALQREGLPVDTREFRPHVTLARHAVHALPRRTATAIHWLVRDYVLVASVRAGEEGHGQPPQQTYRVLAHYGLGGRQVVGEAAAESRVQA